MKLQKLLYYCQAWSIVKNKKRMFDEKIEAWQYGTVIPEIYQKHKGKKEITCWNHGSLEKIESDSTLKEFIDSILQNYGTKSGSFLSHLTHSEDPWLQAKDRADKEITVEDIYNYYNPEDSN